MIATWEFKTGFEPTTPQILYDFQTTNKNLMNLIIEFHQYTEASE